MEQKRVIRLCIVLHLYWLNYLRPSLQSNPLPATGMFRMNGMSWSHWSERATFCADTTARRCILYINHKVPVSSAKTSMFWSYLFPTNNDIPAILGSQKLAAASTLGLLSLRFKLYSRQLKDKKDTNLKGTIWIEDVEENSVSLTGLQASFRRAMDGPSEALAFSNKAEAVYKRGLKLDHSPLEILLFKFRRSCGVF